MIWLRSDDFSRRVELFKTRLNETPDERKTRLQQLSRHGIEKKIAGSRAVAGNQDITQMTLPIWFKEKKREMFKESDPEWQSFLQLQQDKTKQAEIKMKLSKAVASQLRNPQHIRQLQYINFTKDIGAHYVFVTPIYAPIAYEIPRISITHDWKVAFDWQSLPPRGSAKIERMFHPVVFSQAFFAGVHAFSFTTFYITKAKILDQLFGAEPTKIRVSMVQRGNQKIITHVALEKNLTREQQVVTQLPMNRIPEKAANMNLPFLRGASATDSVMKKNYRHMVSSTTYQDAIEHAISVFKQTWLDRQMGALQNTTAGVVAITGFMDCMGDRGKYRLEVTAYYLPAQDAFVGKPQITHSFIIPDLTKTQTKSGATSPNAVVKSQQGSDGNPDKVTSVHQPPTPTEKPSPSKDAGK